MRGVRRVFRLSLLRQGDVARDVDEELASHLAMREAKLRAGGHSPADASRIAKDRFGNIDDIREQCLREAHAHARTERSLQLLDEARRDAHLAVRSLRRAKGFAAAVVVTLALGIGANATIFSLTSAVLLRPVSGVRNVEEVFELSEVVSYPAFRDLASRVPGVRLAGMRERDIALGRGAAVEHTIGGIASGNFFSVAGVEPLIGRVFSAADDVPGAPPVAVLAHDYWAGPLGADSSILGRSVSVNGTPVTVIGIAARDFRGLHLGAEPAIWLPINSWPVIAPASMRRLTLESRNWDWVSVVGRLSRGMSMAQAHRAVATAMTAIVPELPREEIERQSTPRAAQAASLTSGARDSVVRFVAVLAAVVALVLLAACANIAGLLLSRSAYREREFAVRVALGAGRARLVRQLLTEALVLAAAGGAAGILLFLAVRAAIAGSSLPGGIAAGSLELGLDGHFLAFAATITLVTGVLVGLVPALHAVRGDTAAAMKGVGWMRGSRQRLLRGALVTAQVAVGIVLLVGTGLFARSLQRALAVDLGFRTDRLATMSIDAGLGQLEGSRAFTYYRDVTARVRAVPGVEGVTWTVAVPLTSSSDRQSATVDGYTPAPRERVMLEYNAVGPRYHEVVGIDMIAGRGFDEGDAMGSHPVMVVNETLAKRYFAGRSAVGGYITIRDQRFLVVGVARDTKYHALNENPRPYVYFALLQLPNGSQGASPTLLARTAGNPAALLRTIVEAARAVNPGVPVFAPTTMTDRLRRVVAPQLAGAWLLGVFSGLALVLTSVGIYGVVAYAVSQRTREIGIRMALGAGRASVVKVVTGGNLWFVALGIPMGVGLSVALARGISKFLFGIPPTDALTLVATCVLMLGVCAVASYVPARRATRIDPLVALRTDG